jgi:hypothetical protein
MLLISPLEGEMPGRAEGGRRIAAYLIETYAPNPSNKIVDR